MLRLALRIALALTIIGLLSTFVAVRADPAVDRIVIEKAARRLSLLSGGDTIRSYTVALGFAPVGHKQQEGDGRTPEGTYAVVGRNPDSAFHRSLRISYPGAADIAAATARGVSPGGEIFIHGAPNWWFFPGQPPGDWTRGCIAVSSAEIEEIWRLVADGTPVEIKP